MRRQDLTKDYLKSIGVTNVLSDGTIYYKGSIRKQYIYTARKKYGKDMRYKVVSLYDPEHYKKQCEKAGHPLGRDGAGMKYFCVNRIVYAWFHGMCPKEMDVDHIDGDTLNNFVSNLQLLTRKENLRKRDRQSNQHTVGWSDEKYKSYVYYRDRIRYMYVIIQERKSIIAHDLEALDKLLKNPGHKSFNRLREELQESIKTGGELLKQHYETRRMFIKKLKEIRESE